MLKHVHTSPLRNRSDSISLHSTTSSASSSKCSSPEPTNEPQTRILSKASSYLSLTESVPQVRNNKLFNMTFVWDLVTSVCSHDL